MGFGKGLRKPGGGILHNREGAIESYEFTTDTPWAQKKANEGLLYLVITVKEDGADATTTQHLFLGSTEYYDVSEDGQEVSSIDRDTTSVNTETGAGKFLASLLEVGFPEDRLPDLEGGDALNLKGMVGVRVRFEQRLNEALTKEKGKRKAKNGKEYSYTDLVVAEVLSLPAAGKAGKANGKAAKPNGKAAVADDEDVDDLSAATVKAILKAEESETINVKKLKMAIFGNLGTKHPQRDAVIKFATDPANLAAMDGIEFDAKTGVVSLA